MKPVSTIFAKKSTFAIDTQMERETPWIEFMAKYSQFLWKHKISTAVGMPNVIIWAYYFWKNDVKNSPKRAVPVKESARLRISWIFVFQGRSCWQIELSTFSLVGVHEKHMTITYFVQNFNQSVFFFWGGCFWLSWLIFRWNRLVFESYQQFWESYQQACLFFVNIFFRKPLSITYLFYNFASVKVRD